nr:IS110 family transposase [uncultured Aminipila sp.]
MISIGIDVSKGKSTVCFLKLYGEIVYKPFEIIHTESSLSHLLNLISSIGDEDIRVVMEATGNYHLPILNFLKSYNVFVSVINPLIMHKYANLSLRRGKTDPLDSVKIANYGLDNWYNLKDYSPSTALYNELKLLNRQYLNYIKIRINAKQTLTNLLDSTMPGIKTMFFNRSDTPNRDKLCAFVKEYWHYDNITKMSESAFTNHYLQWNKNNDYRGSIAKAHNIYILANDSIPTLSSSLSSTKFLVLEAVQTLHNIDTTIADILAKMKELSKTLKEYETVLAMPGVGEILAPRLIAEIGDISRFRNASALVAFAGLDAPPFQSGNYISTNRSISKRGSSTLRKTGYEIMKCLKTVKPTKDAAVYLFMLKKESEGKPLKVAKIAALNKFLRIYYARVKEIYN